MQCHSCKQVLHKELPETTEEKCKELTITREEEEAIILGFIIGLKATQVANNMAINTTNNALLLCIFPSPDRFSLNSKKNKFKKTTQEKESYLYVISQWGWKRKYDFSLLQQQLLLLLQTK